MGITNFWKKSDKEYEEELKKQQIDRELSEERLKQQYQDDLEEERRTRNRVVARLNEELERDKEQHARAIESLRQERISELSQLIQRHEDAAQLSRQQLDSTKDQADRKEKRMAAEQTRTVQDLNQSHAAKVAQMMAFEQQLIAKHDQQTKRLQGEVQGLNEALLTRDDEIYQGTIFTAPDLPRKPDDKIRDQFLEMQQMVETLGRLTWKQNQQVWTDSVLQDIGRQQVPRALKKGILQHIMWTLLFNRVFCSPFRLFGEEGTQLESEWNEQCGKGQDQF